MGNNILKIKMKNNLDNGNEIVYNVEEYITKSGMLLKMVSWANITGYNDGYVLYKEKTFNDMISRGLWISIE